MVSVIENVVLQVGDYTEKTQLYVSFGFGLKDSLQSGSISVNLVGKVDQATDLTDPTVIHSAQMQTEHPSFTVTPDLVASRNLAIAAAVNSPLYQAMNNLSNQGRAAARDAHVHIQAGRHPV